MIVLQLSNAGEINNDPRQDMDEALLKPFKRRPGKSANVFFCCISLVFFLKIVFKSKFKVQHLKFHDRYNLEVGN